MKVPANTWLGLAFLTLLLASYLSLGVGVIELSPKSLISPSERELSVLLHSRVPRLMAILLAGSALAVAGLIMQQVTQNRFVSPTTSGTMEAALLGLLISLLIFDDASLLQRMLLAIGCAVLGTYGFLMLLTRLRQTSGLNVALIGIMYGGVLSAIGTFFALRHNMLQVIEVWASGSFSGVISGRYEPLYCVLITGAVAYFYADRFTVVGMGKSFANNLGVNYKTTLYVGLTVVSLVAAVVVVVVGMLPFLGLIVPNIVSLWTGDNTKRALPITALLGASFVLLCDVLARTIRFPYEIPASVIAGVLGSTVFIWLILRAARRGTS